MSAALIQTTSSISIASNELVFPCFTNQRYRFYLSVAPQQQHTNTQFILCCQSQSQNHQHTSKSKPTKKPLSLYLTETLGFSEEQSLAASSLLRRLRKCEGATDLISCENADKVISYLQDKNECGLNLSQIKKIVVKYPRILTADVDKIVRPRITKLQQVGFSTSDDLARVLASNPFFYLVKDLSPAIEALTEIMGSEEPQGIVKFFRRLSWGNTGNITSHLIANVTMLENEFGISRAKIRKFVCSYPGVFMIKTETLRDTVVKIEDKWGITRDSKEFLRALKVFCGLTDEKINSKCQVFKSFGWSQSDILTFARLSPFCFASSEARINNFLEFYMNELGLKPAYLASRPELFFYSLEHRVVPRLRVLFILKEKGLIKADYQLNSCLIYTDKKFYDKFISPYENVVPKLREVYIEGGVPSEALVISEASENENETLVPPCDG